MTLGPGSRAGPGAAFKNGGECPRVAQMRASGATPG
jgi:hypothetical protein